MAPAKKLQSVERTVVNCKVTATQEYVSNPPPKLSSQMYLVDFEVLSRTPPFSVNVMGIVTSIDEETRAQSEIPMRSFRLQDSAGTHVACIAHGRHVDHPGLDVANEILFFHYGARRTWEFT